MTDHHLAMIEMTPAEREAVRERIAEREREVGRLRARNTAFRLPFEEKTVAEKADAVEDQSEKLRALLRPSARE